MPDKQLPASLAARAAAADLLQAVLARRQAYDIAVAQHSGFASLPPRDRAFTQLLVKTTLRRLGQIDALITSFLSSPLPESAGEARNILRIGLTQLLWLDTPPHAAVHSGVELGKAGKSARFASLINALLQRAVREGASLVASQDAAALNTPAWLWESWKRHYGEERARLIANAHLQEPPLDLSVKETPERWAELLQGERLENGSVRLQRAGNVTELPGFTEGAWWVQDAAASLPAQLLGDVAGKSAVDLCAAPGGKTAQLVAMGAHVIALDISPARLKLVEENLARLTLSARCVATDALAWQPGTPPDVILLDAPCSATGTLRRHPDVAWHRNPADIARLRAAQARLLQHAGNMLAPGGRLVYAVCSLQPEEGEGQMQAFLQNRQDFRLVPAMLPYAEAGEWGLRTLPCFLPDSGGMDGFFMALLEKTK